MANISDPTAVSGCRSGVGLERPGDAYSRTDGIVQHLRELLEGGGSEAGILVVILLFSC